MTPSPFEADRQSVTLGGQLRITIDYRDTPADQPSDMRRVAASIPILITPEFQPFRGQDRPQVIENMRKESMRIFASSQGSASGSLPCVLRIGAGFCNVQKTWSYL